MKRFIIKISVIFIVVISSIILITFVSDTIIWKYGNYTIGNGNVNLILGHSHAENAYNDSFIYQTKNLAHAGESYFYTFLKSKPIINNNEDLINVFIEFSHYNVLIQSDDNIWEESNLNYRFQKYAPFMNLREYWFVFKKNPIEVVKNHSLALRANFINLFRLNKNLIEKNNWGGFNELDYSRIDELLAVLSRNGSHNNFEKSVYGLVYLRKLIDQYRDAGVNVYLIVSPIHIHQQYLKYDSQYREIKDNLFDDIVLLDFSKYPLFNHQYADFGHLNGYGAEEFSRFFNELLVNGLLDEGNPQNLIDKKIKEIVEDRNPFFNPGLGFVKEK